MDPLVSMVQYIQVRVSHMSPCCVSDCPSVLIRSRKLFTFVVALNAAGIALAAFGYFPYAEKWTSAMALGNLNCAILMRNELFGRFLYLFVNACFAKVTFPMFLPLSLIRFSLIISGHPYGGDLVARLFFRYSTSAYSQADCASSPHNGIAASRRHSQRMCFIRYWLAYPQGREHLPKSFRQQHFDPCCWGGHQRCHHHQFPERSPLCEEYPPQVRVL